MRLVGHNSIRILCKEITDKDISSYLETYNVAGSEHISCASYKVTILQSKFKTIFNSDC